MLASQLLQIKPVLQRVEKVPNVYALKSSYFESPLVRSSWRRMSWRKQDRKSLYVRNAATAMLFEQFVWQLPLQQQPRLPETHLLAMWSSGTALRLIQCPKFSSFSRDSARFFKFMESCFKRYNKFIRSLFNFILTIFYFDTRCTYIKYIVQVYPTVFKIKNRRDFFDRGLPKCITYRIEDKVLNRLQRQATLMGDCDDNMYFISLQGCRAVDCSLLIFSSIQNIHYMSLGCNGLSELEQGVEFSACLWG